MTIDEVIIRIKEKMACDYNISGCDTCNISSCEDKDIVIQLAEWLKELKALNNGLNIKCDNLNEALEKGKKIGYKKAIDDFVAKLKEHKYTCNFDWEYYEEIAEQLNGGIMNDNR